MEKLRLSCSCYVLATQCRSKVGAVDAENRHERSEWEFFLHFLGCSQLVLASRWRTTAICIACSHLNISAAKHTVLLIGLQLQSRGFGPLAKIIERAKLARSIIFASIAWFALNTDKKIGPFSALGSRQDQPADPRPNLVLIRPWL